MMKKLFAILFTISLCISAYADAFTDILQDLAMQTACLGQYSNEEAGNYNNPDPHNYYTPELLRKRFASMSGERTRIQTFYGVCFDYAQSAWDDIKKYQASYNNKGMKNQEWYIAAVDDDPNLISLYDPIPENRVRWSGYRYIDTKDGSTLTKVNGVYCKKKRDMRVQAHKHSDGSYTTWHAWLWVQRTNGTWYWVDPTWTDNTGYVWYGYVSNTNNGKEIPLTPDARYCVDTSSIPRVADNRSNYKPSPSYKPSPRYKPYHSFYIGEGYGTAIGVLYGVPFYGHEVSMYDYYQEQDSSTPFTGYSREKELLRSDRFTGSLFIAGIHENISAPDVFLVSIDYMRSNTDNEDANSIMASFAIGPSPFEHLGFYIGGGLGIGVDNKAEEKSLETEGHKTDDTYVGFVGDAKVNVGALLCFKPLMLRFDVAYDWVLGFTMGCGVGIVF